MVCRCRSTRVCPAEYGAFGGQPRALIAGRSAAWRTHSERPGHFARMRREHMWKMRHDRMCFWSFCCQSDAAEFRVSRGLLLVVVVWRKLMAIG
eukprot:3840153-Prymnesium_polylepis.2